MKKLFFLLICTLFIGITFLILTSPDQTLFSRAFSSNEILKENLDNDIFLYNKTVYFSNENYDWKENKFQLTMDQEIGEIETTSNKMLSYRLFQDFTATKLPKGTKLFSTNNNGTHFLIAIRNGEKILYEQMVEG